jgi:hypothetical protein
LPASERDILTRLRPRAASLVPGLAVVVLMLDWAIQNGGYDPSTWYWGALLIVSGLGFVLLRGPRTRLRRSTVIALGALTLYVAWSYLSIAWAASPGDALQGSNRALLYLALFGLIAILPWTRGSALAALLLFAAGVGGIGIVFLARLANRDNVAAIIVNGRLQAPTGYFNSSVALFMVGALLAVALAADRVLPVPIRGLLLGAATAGLELAVAGGSRGWLFTLPLVLLATIAVVRDRVRFIVAAVLPVAATGIVAHRLLDIYAARNAGAAGLADAAAHAGGPALLTCAITVVLGTALATADALLRPPAWLRLRRRALSLAIATLALVAAVAGGVAATHGHPIAFVKRQWHGFSQGDRPSAAASHFDVVGSGRYDIWRVGLDAFVAHPIGGLGQDNFADYYIVHRRTVEEPAWTHSLEIRLLAHSGLVGAALFLAFLIAAGIAALRRGATDRTEVDRWVIGAALLPFVVWLIHGSIDWFWELPALSGPALAFLAVAGALNSPASAEPSPDVVSPGEPAGKRWRPPRPVLTGVSALALLAATLVLALPYLSVVEQTRAAREAANPAQALSDYTTAADLNPLSPSPGRAAGYLALESGQYEVALQRFRQAISREPGGWLGWLGAGLAASQLGEVAVGRHDLQVARSIDRQQPAISEALARVGTAHPLPASEALKLLILAL